MQTGLPQTSYWPVVPMFVYKIHKVAVAHIDGASQSHTLRSWSASWCRLFRQLYKEPPHKNITPKILVLSTGFSGFLEVRMLLWHSVPKLLPSKNIQSWMQCPGTGV